MPASPPAAIPLILPAKEGSLPDRRWLKWQQLRHQLRLQVQQWTRPRAPYRPVFVLATHRSGSNLLMDYVNRLPGAKCVSEVLCQTMVCGITKRQLRPDRALRHISLSLHPHKTPVRGCKIMLNQLGDCGLTLDALDAAFPGACYLILYRQSLVEQYVSREAAKATAQWVLFDGQERQQARVRVEPAKLRVYCEQIRKSYRQILDHAWLPERSVLLSYEELTAGPAGWFRDHICPLLELSPSPPETKLRKQNTLPMSERVSNYREAASLLDSPLCRQYYTWPDRQVRRRQAA